jgi:arginyl-tRNA synthetase
MNLLNEIKSRFADALRPLTDDAGAMLDLLRPSQDAKFGDFQANCAMPLSKMLSRPAREVAAEIVERLVIDDLCEPPQIAGPGFINLTLRDDVIATRIESIAGDDRLGVEAVRDLHTVVVDFSSPNVAKPMHVGHLRSTVIGDAISRMLRFTGHNVITDNHIGDWGTQFGMIIYGYRHFADKAAYQQKPVAELARLYRLVNQLSDYHTSINSLDELRDQCRQSRVAMDDAAQSSESGGKKARKLRKSLTSRLENARTAVKAAEARVAAVDADAALKVLAEDHQDIVRRARAETAKLHADDSENRELWDEFMPTCLAALQTVYDRLDIHFDLTLGESFYNPMLSDIVDQLKEQGLASNSDGATCVFLDGNDAPFIVQKTDGAFTYATTDLATIRHRKEILDASEMLYVVDNRQSEHFQLLFRTAMLMSFDDLKLQHVTFGTVMGPDGKPYKTRSGDTVGLESLIDEAIAHARQVVDETDDRRTPPLLSDEQRQQVAEIVGIGGIKYADLRHNRDSDYIFDWDKMLAKTGDTATYMQYAYARICGIFRKLNVDRYATDFSEWNVLLSGPEERALALQLLQLEYAIDSALTDYRPHLLAGWLFATADRFSKFYDKCSVQNAETVELQHSRLVLCDLVARGLRTGLYLLGIHTADVM